MTLSLPRIAAAAFACLLVSLPAAAAERRYPVVDFDRVQVDGPFQVRVTTGLPTSASATGSQQALDRVSVEVQGSTLHVRANRSAWGGYPGEAAGAPATVSVSTRMLRFAGIGGAGSVSVDKVKGARLDLALAGSGRIAIASVDVDSLGVNMLGAGRVALAGKAKQMRSTVQGAGEIDAPGLRVDDLQLTAETAGNIALAAIRTAKVKSTGAGNIAIPGPAACTVEALGAGNVLCGKGR